MCKFMVAIVCAVAASGCTCNRPSEAVQTPAARVAQAPVPVPTPAPVAAVPEVKPAAVAPAEPGEVAPGAGAEAGGDDAPWPTLPEGKSSGAEPLKVEEPNYGTSCRSWAAYTVDTVMFGEFNENSVTRVFKGHPKGECGDRTSAPLMTVKLEDSCNATLLLPNHLLLGCSGSPTSYYIYSIPDGKRVFSVSCSRTAVGEDWFECVSGLEPTHECAGRDGDNAGFVPALVKRFDSRTGEETRSEPKACIYVE